MRSNPDRTNRRQSLRDFRFGDGRIDRQRAPRGLLRLPIRVGRRQDAEVPENVVRIGEARVRQRVARIELDGAPILVEARAQRLRRATLPEVAAADVRAVGCGRRRPSAANVVAFSCGQVRDEGFCNPAGNGILDAALGGNVRRAIHGRIRRPGPAASCSNIDLTVTATLNPNMTAAGSVSGDLNGPVAAEIDQIVSSGDGTLHLRLRHQFTNTNPFGRIDTSDHAVLAPVDKDVGGAGIYAGATGYLDAHGTVDFGTGAIDLRESGRVCVQ
jgi:hypothetical protein